MDNLLPFPTPSIEDQLAVRAGSTKTALAYYDQDGNLVTFLGDDMTHMELVFLIDTLRKRADSIFG
jgi:hypothetical protein